MTGKAVAIAIGAAALLIAPAGVLASTHQVGSLPASTAGLGSTTQTVNWQIPLAAGKHFPRVAGSAQYQAQPGQRELQVELEHLRALAGRSLRVQVDGVRVGSMKVSRQGIAQLTLNTELGQKVPVVQHGALVAVKTAIVIASGTF